MDKNYDIILEYSVKKSGNRITEKLNFRYFATKNLRKNFETFLLLVGINFNAHKTSLNKTCPKKAHIHGQIWLYLANALKMFFAITW